MPKNAAVEKMAAAIKHPEAHQIPAGQTQQGDDGNATAVPDPTPGTAARGNPTHQLPTGVPASPPQPPVVPAGQQQQPPEGQQTAQQPQVITDISKADFASVAARLKEFAGDEGVDPNDALAANINERLAKARQQEKDKLYQQIEALKADVVTSQRVSEEQAAAIKNLSEGKTPDGQTPQPKKKEGDEGEHQGMTTEQFQSAIDAGLARMQEVYETKMGELRSQITTLTEKAEAETVGSYKTSLIEANRGTIIEELVIGNTKEDLDNALVMAKQAFAKYATDITQDGQAAASRAPSVPPAPTLTGQPAGGTHAPSGGVQVTVPGKMSDYATDRESILAAASQAARQAIGGLGPS